MKYSKRFRRLTIYLFIHFNARLFLPEKNFKDLKFFFFSIFGFLVLSGSRELLQTLLLVSWDTLFLTFRLLQLMPDILAAHNSRFFIFFLRKSKLSKLFFGFVVPKRSFLALFFSSIICYCSFNGNCIFQLRRSAFW